MIKCEDESVIRVAFINKIEGLLNKKSVVREGGVGKVGSRVELKVFEFGGLSDSPKILIIGHFL